MLQRGESLLLGVRPPEDDVFLGPAMDVTAVRAGNLLLLHLGCSPECFLNRFTRIGKPGSRRATHQHAFHVAVRLGLRFARRIK